MNSGYFNLNSLSVLCLVLNMITRKAILVGLYRETARYLDVLRPDNNLQTMGD